MDIGVNFMNSSTESLSPFQLQSLQKLNNLAALIGHTPLLHLRLRYQGQVFNIGNIGPESKIKRLAPMHSVSVGDVIVDAEGHAVYVSTFGFKPMGFNLFSS